MRKQFGLLLLFAASLAAVRAVAQNVTFDEATVINPSPYRIGINIGSQDYYSGEALQEPGLQYELRFRTGAHPGHLASHVRH